MSRAALLLLCLLALPAAAPPPGPVLDPPPGAWLPTALALRDEAGRGMTLDAALGGHPAVLIFADFTCATLCGTAIGLAAAALPATGLVPGRDYRLLVLGLDPRDGPAEAVAMRRTHLTPGSPLDAATRFLLADDRMLDTAEAALGYRAVFHPETDSFDHPLALLVLAPDGRLVAALPGLGLDAAAIRAALVAAAQPDGAPRLVQRVLLACRGFGAIGTGARGAVMTAALALGASVALGGLAGMALLLRPRRLR